MKIDRNWPALSSEEAKRLAEEGKANVSSSSASKSVKQIILSNLFTFYNMLNLVLAALVITTGSYRNMLFLGIVISNFFIGTIQEETHRFAITYHRQLRSKRLQASELDGIAGIGPKRKQALLKAFKSISAIAQAELYELERHLPKDAARNVYQHFHQL